MPANNVERRSRALVDILHAGNLRMSRPIRPQAELNTSNPALTNRYHSVHDQTLHSSSLHPYTTNPVLVSGGQLGPTGNWQALQSHTNGELD